jgi:transcriptional regulator with XRE-family HTH domain
LINLCKRGNFIKLRPEQLRRKVKAGISQADLAYSIQMDAQHISRIERRLANPSAFTVWQICQALQVSVGDFYTSLSKKV